MQTAGFYSVQWDGTNQSGMTLSSGMYYYRIQAGQHSDVHKMLFMK
jgi:flagellar hook assembly protein FlgD